MALVLGTFGMLLLVFGIILYVVIYQRKILKKKEELERLRNKLYAQQLDSAYSTLDVQSKERKRIAREVHDNLGSLLSALRIFADLLPTKSGDELVQFSKELARTTQEASDVSRGIAHSLALNQFGKTDFLNAIQELKRTLDLMGKPKLTDQDIQWLELDDGEWLEVLRIIQELINNTLKHAKSSEVSIEYVLRGKNQALIYHDNGLGFDATTGAKGFGLQSIEQRAAIVNAEFILITSPGYGTRAEFIFSDRMED